MLTGSRSRMFMAARQKPMLTLPFDVHTFLTGFR
jgi:hypothetical protein